MMKILLKLDDCQKAKLVRLALAARHGYNFCFRREQSEAKD